MTVTPGENSIFLEWSPPSEGSPLSYTVTWTGRGVTSSHVLPPTARNYTIRGLDSNTAYSGTLKVCETTANDTAPWDQYTLPQGELYTGGHGVPEHRCFVANIYYSYHASILHAEALHSLLHTLQFSQHCASCCMIHTL